MADLDDSEKTLTTQGKFIYSADRLAAEARARALRAAAIRQGGRRIAAMVGGWFGHRAATVGGTGRIRPRTA